MDINVQFVKYHNTGKGFTLIFNDCILPCVASRANHIERNNDFIIHASSEFGRIIIRYWNTIVSKETEEARTVYYLKMPSGGLVFVYHDIRFILMKTNYSNHKAWLYSSNYECLMVFEPETVNTVFSNN